MAVAVVCLCLFCRAARGHWRQRPAAPRPAVVRPSHPPAPSAPIRQRASRLCSPEAEGSEDPTPTSTSSSADSDKRHIVIAAAAGWRREGAGMGWRRASVQALSWGEQQADAVRWKGGGEMRGGEGRGAELQRHCGGPLHSGAPPFPPAIPRPSEARASAVADWVTSPQPSCRESAPLEPPRNAGPPAPHSALLPRKLSWCRWLPPPPPIHPVRRRGRRLRQPVQCLRVVERDREGRGIRGGGRRSSSRVPSSDRRGRHAPISQHRQRRTLPGRRH